MRGKFYTRIFLPLSSFIIVAFVLLVLVFIGIGGRYMLQERQESLENNAIEITRLSSVALRSGELDTLSEWNFRVVISSIARSTGNHCFITDADGTVVLCSDDDLGCGHVGRQIGGGVMETLAADESYSGLTTLGDFYLETRYVAALPIISGGDSVPGYVFVASSVDGIMQVWSNIIECFLFIVVAVMLFTVIGSFISSRRWSRPLRELADAAVCFAHGDFSVRVSGAERDDEFGPLANSFNQMAESLEQSEKRRDDLIANVAHELKTPMTTISGFADGILDGTIPAEQTNHYLETISSETKWLNRLVRSMLDLSRMKSLASEELMQRSFDATELLARTLVIFEGKINAKHLDVNVLIPEDPMLVCGDADAINQVIYNLLENAVKFAQEGSELAISLFKQVEKAYISIKNHGPVIPAEELPLIFDRFHKADKSRSADRDGYGLGLYIVKTILNNHGEDIAVTSRDGATEFVFSLTLKQK